VADSYHRAETLMLEAHIVKVRRSSTVDVR
jgi:hypothetical protein